MRENRFQTRLKAGHPSLVGWMSTDSLLIAETLARLNFDAVTIDLQHGTAETSGLMSMLQAVSLGGATPLVRVPANDSAMIGRALDMGGYGVIVPMIESPGDVERMVKACRYPPVGMRSFGPIRGVLYGGNDYAGCADDTVLAIAMIETRAAVEALDDILKVPGLDAVFVGPADLSQSYGGPAGSDWTEGPIPALLEQIVRSCHIRGMPAGIFTRSPDYAARMIALGFTFVTIKNDIAYLNEGVTAALESAAEWRTPTN